MSREKQPWIADLETATLVTGWLLCDGVMHTAYAHKVLRGNGCTGEHKIVVAVPEKEEE